MALQSYTLTIGALIDENNSGKNYVSDQPIYIKTKAGVLAPIFRDINGASEIFQDGLSNKTDSRGQFVFFVEQGDYIAEYQSQQTPISVFGADYFNSRIDESVAQITADTALSRGYNRKGTFASGFTYELANDVGIDANGDAWVYADIDALPAVVTAGTVPSEPDYTTVVLSDAESVKNTDGSSAQDTYDATKALLVAQGFSGNYGFFEKGFAYSTSGDVGIDVDGNMWTYSGGDPLPITVTAGTNPASSNDFNIFSNYTFSTVDDLRNAELDEGTEARTLGYHHYWYTLIEDTSSKYIVKTTAQASVDGDIIDEHGSITLKNGNVAILKVKNEVNSGSFGIEAGALVDNTVNTARAQALLNFAIHYSVKAVFSKGEYFFNDTIAIENSKNLKVRGAGAQNTILRFNNAIENKVFIDLKRTSTYSVFKGIALADNTPGTSICFRLEDTLNSGTIANWKNKVEDFRIVSFKIGFLATTQNPLDGATHAYLDSTLFLNGKFRNCRTSYVNQNIQAVNINFITTDIENDDPGETYTMIRDEAGGTFNIEGGSFIGSGLIFEGIYPAGGSTLWTAGFCNFNDVRFEIRDSMKFLELPESSNFISCDVNFQSCNLQGSGGSPTLIDWAGKGNLNINNSRFVDMVPNVILRPCTIAASLGVNGPAHYGRVNIENSGRVTYEKSDTARAGLTYGEEYTSPVNIRNQANDALGQCRLDDDGFYEMKFANYNQRGYGWGFTQESMLVFNNDRRVSGFTSAKVKLPFGGTPTKLVLFKSPQRQSLGIQYKLYVVKDKPDWAGATFDVSTDAIEISDTGSTAGKSGYMEFDINLVSSYFASSTEPYFESGLGSWVEGRLFLERNGNTTPMSGFVGVKYV